jgi:AraC-like DNA-binding protein
MNVTRRSYPVELIASVRNAKDRIDHEYGQRLPLDALADTAHYSKYHFVRAFAAMYGETPRAYLTRRRIERAKDLLRGANLTVTEVCLLVGFESVGWFSWRFKQLVGVSPTHYRQQTMADGGPPPIPGCFVLMWTRPSGQQSAIHKKRTCPRTE